MTLYRAAQFSSTGGMKEMYSAQNDPLWLVTDEGQVFRVIGWREKDGLKAVTTTGNGTVTLLDIQDDFAGVGLFHSERNANVRGYANRRR
jgi:hypothetical protein